MKVRDVMTPDIEVLNPDDTLRTAVRLMADLDVGALPVSDNNNLVGTITGRDIAMCMVEKNRDAAEIAVAEAMSSDVLYCFENEPIGAVARKMSDWWVRRLPVVSHDKRPIGIVCLADVAALPSAAPASRKIRGSSRPSQAARSQRRIRRHRGTAAAA